MTGVSIVSSMIFVETFKGPEFNSAAISSVSSLVNSPEIEHFPPVMAEFTRGAVQT